MKKYLVFVIVLTAFLTASAQTVYLSDDFEDGNMDGWVESPDTSWEASTVGAITGTYSLKHISTDTTGGSHIRTPLSGLDVTAQTTRWRFNLKNGDFDPTGAEKFWVYIMVHDTTAVNGYAVGVNLSGDTDTLTLWKVTGSAPDGIVLQTGFDWNNNTLLGIEVTRDTSGLWELKYDKDGGFDNLISAGAATNTDYITANYFGLSFYFNSHSRGELWLDDVLVQSGERVNANITAFLEGPFDADSMKTDLSSAGVIPLAHPFSGPPWNYTGEETIPVAGDDFVDWVLVQLRTGTDSSTTIATRAALLMENGNIADMDGSSLLSFSGISAGNYYVVIRPRNHLAVMTANAIALSAASTEYDFSSAVTQAYGTGAQVEVTSGVFGLITGDANGNGQIQTDDNNDIWEVEVGSAGYKRSDYNLNGQVQTDDKNDFWNNNVGKGTQVPF